MPPVSGTAPIAGAGTPGHLFPAHEPVRTQEKPLLDVITGLPIVVNSHTSPVLIQAALP
ncbi:hypothetical protein HMPREF0290_2328 [Corynebacterium efficiens YS-314]|nr:hypothetical protein HMPREF0290_2328 [Corynebacterium efficiens YS-314]